MIQSIFVSYFHLNSIFHWKCCFDDGDLYVFLAIRKMNKYQLNINKINIGSPFYKAARAVHLILQAMMVN